MTRRPTFAIVLLIPLFVLAACGAPAPTTETANPSPETATPSSAAESSPTPEATPSAVDAFPMTIEHKFGSTEIAERPERVVSLGYNDQDPILALGVKPIAVRYWFGDPANQVWPWAQDELGDAQPEVLNMPFGELNFEAIAALQPDLIIGVSSGITAEEYETLSEIAPTVAQSDEYVDFGVPWQEQTEVIGRALGEEARARELVAAMEERFAQVRAEHPEFASATAAIAAPSSDGQFLFSGPQHERQRFLTSLGFELPDELAEIAGDQFYGSISGERLDLLDTDVLIWTVDDEQRAAIEADPLYQQLDVAQDGRAIFLDTSGEGDLAGPALVFSSVLSLPVVFDELVPQLAAALDRQTGAPEATPDTAATPEANNPSPGILQVLEETDQDRLIKHSLGETRVPLAPKRVVTLQDQNALLPLFELGFTDVVGSVGAVREDGTAFFRRMEQYDTSNVVYVGEYGTPNLEQIAALKPDLIVGSQYEINEENYDLLSQIAPAVPVEQFTRPIWESSNDYALLVDKQAQAAALKSRYDARIAEVRAQLGDPSQITASLFGTWEGTISVEASPYVSYLTVFNDLGLSLTEVQRQALATGEYAELSVESLPQLDGDVIFVPAFGQANTDTSFVKSSPLWQQLNAVQKGQAHEVPGEQWFGMAYQALFNVLDGVEQHMIERPLDASWEPQP